MNIDDSIAKKTEQESKEDYQKCSLHDPFPSIIPAFLNPIDIKKYIYTVGIIYPYNKKNLTNATYKIPLAGDIYTWEYNKEKGDKELKKITITDNDKETVITLQKNSITYIHISTIFRVPYYMVYRFNLTVSLAQKGLLLGTGPIIDPGFEGRIMIPIHNLTANDYKLQANSGLIRVEFTKISPNDYFIPGKKDDNYKYLFPEKVKNLTATEYFKDINQNNPISSSIPEAILESKQKAIEASDSVNKIKKIAWGAAIISVLAIVVGIVYPTWNIINDTNSFYNNVENKINKNESTMVELQHENKELKNEIQKLKKYLKNDLNGTN